MIQSVLEVFSNDKRYEKENNFINSFEGLHNGKRAMSFYTNVDQLGPFR